MVKQGFIGSESLVVPILSSANPNPGIYSVIYPSSPQKQGDSVKTLIDITNYGFDGFVTAWVKENNTTGPILGSAEKFLPANESFVFDVTFAMPNRDITIVPCCGYVTTVTDSKASKLIELLSLTIATKITNWSVTPAVVSPTGTLSFKGTLQRQDNNLGINAQLITIQRKKVGEATWVAVATATTDANGTFPGGVPPGSMPAPPEGSYEFKAVFAGGTYLGLTLLPTESRTSSLIVFEAVDYVVPLVSAAALGLVGYVAAPKRHKTKASIGLGLVGLAAGLGIRYWQKVGS